MTILTVLEFWDFNFVECSFAELLCHVTERHVLPVKRVGEVTRIRQRDRFSCFSRMGDPVAEYTARLQQQVSLTRAPSFETTDGRGYVGILLAVLCFSLSVVCSARLMKLEAERQHVALTGWVCLKSAKAS